MAKHTKEKGLIEVNNTIFSKIRRFFMKRFWRKKDIQDLNEQENTEDEISRELENEENLVKKKRPLYNFDADDEEKNNETLNIEDYFKTSTNINGESSTNSNSSNDVEEEYTIGIKKETTVYEEKEELERKLMKYYQSIKNIANLSLK